MRQAENRVISSAQATGLELMERAGQGVVDAVFAHWPELLSGQRKAVVLSGPGNNGGDGFVIARLLLQLGWQVAVFCLGDAEKLPRDARANFDRLAEVRSLNALTRTDFRKCDVIFDALFGTGLTRGLARELHTTLQDALASDEKSTAHMVSVDIPSGICSDSGRVLGGECALKADLTVTFHRRKLGHVLGDGPSFCGAVRTVDIGLGFEEPQSDIALESEVDPILLGKQRLGHKFTNGSALILSGGIGKTGAARLSARAALRIGAGIVTLGAPKEAIAEIAAHITALMVTQIEDSDDLTKALSDERITALCLGPGLGQERARDLVVEALRSQRPLKTVLDADALSAFATDPAQLFRRLNENCVLTPHFGEFSKLFPDIAGRLNAHADTGPAYSKVDAARAAAERAGCTVLLKGPDTVIADQSGACRIHAASGVRAAPWLATAGAGDILAGFITGLLARGLAPLEAASTATHLHVDCALQFGPGLIAEDLPEVLPDVLARYLKGV